MRPSTWAGVVVGAAVVYFFDDLRGPERRHRLLAMISRDWDWIGGRRVGAPNSPASPSGPDWPISVVSIDVERPLGDEALS